MKLVEIEYYWEKKPLLYRTRLKHFAVQGKDVCHWKIRRLHNTMHAHLVTLRPGLPINLDQDVHWPNCSLTLALAKGYVSKHGMRKFVLNEAKPALGMRGRNVDDKCISVPEWIDSFRDL
ncbi:hypothetical protein AVEN_70254-1 [Araneus ventricosus]|uniref:Uncharacterized protein n=1 Tax=Araneus ventricosus TaxID=182803 RepID=A0A4Y2G9X5_ARAVE|nr:hypothetical protein AVEN_70254-1 [Araneus ventricosus]